MSEHFDFNEYFIMEEQKRIIYEADKNAKVLKQISRLVKQKNNNSYIYIRQLSHETIKNKLSFDFYDSQCKINKSFYNTLL